MRLSRPGPLKALILNTDDTVVRQELDRSFAVETVDLLALRPGLQFYADRTARALFRKVVGRAPTSHVCLIGSGDFHHLTLLRLERLAGPFLLVVFDNHSDCSSIGPRYHCGNWLYHAALLSGCRKVLHFGSTEHRGFTSACFGSGRLIRKGSWIETPGRDVTADSDIQRFAETLAGHNPERIPVYASIDKDVLCGEEAPGDWENGVLRLEQLRAMLEHLTRAYPVAGADITGEKGGAFHYPSRPLKNVLSRIEHRNCRDATPITTAIQKQRAVNCALLEVLGVDRVG